MATPFELIGGSEKIRALVETFYDVMGDDEPALTRLHQIDERGQVSRPMRDRFALYLVGWMGGPQEYVLQHGHPRLRMRHFRVPVDLAMRDAWLRCMAKALDQQGVAGELRAFLDERLAALADHMRNVEEPGVY
jgi:hemoglobin